MSDQFGREDDALVKHAQEDATVQRERHAGTKRTDPRYGKGLQGSGYIVKKMPQTMLVATLIEGRRLRQPFGAFPDAEDEMWRQGMQSDEILRLRPTDSKKEMQWAWEDPTSEVALALAEASKTGRPSDYQELVQLVTTIDRDVAALRDELVCPECERADCRNPNHELRVRRRDIPSEQLQMNFNLSYNILWPRIREARNRNSNNPEIETIYRMYSIVLFAVPWSLDGHCDLVEMCLAIVNAEPQLPERQARRLRAFVNAGVTANTPDKSEAIRRLYKGFGYQSLRDAAKERLGSKSSIGRALRGGAPLSQTGQESLGR